ncbi:AAA family ATPase [Vibrio rotiferianus]|uniref:AAA family ATPase n=2 Tax=Vibrio rotiferianus TaxID=190895 RepID=UPI0020127465|nr:AAA family ATPase [Vibrio rotiferianus]
MKIKSLKVMSFRNINGKNNILDFNDSDIIFIFGQNNVGKSTFLHAYEYFVTSKKKCVLSDFHNFDESNIIEMEMVFIKEEGDSVVFDKKGLSRWVSSENEIKFKKTWSQAGKEGKKETFDPAIGKYVDNGFGGFDAHLSKEAPTPIVIPAMPTPDELSKWITETIKKQVLKTLSTEHAEAYQEALDKLNELQSTIEDTSLVKGFADKANSNFQKVFPELSLSISPVIGQEVDVTKALDKEFCVAINNSETDGKSEFNSHGHGVIRQAMFNFLGLSKNNYDPEDGGEVVKKEFIILFEEPELYLHPKRIRLLKDTLYSLCHKSKFQILCASHNPQLIDLSKPHTTLARLTVNGDKTTDIHQVGDDVFDAQGENRDRILMLNRFNPHVCETFFADEVVLVEGDTEAIVVRQLLHEHYPERDIFVLNTGTKNNMPFFIKVLTHFKIKQHVIHDSDCRYQYDKSGNPIRKNDQTPKRNSAWTLNQTIWDEMVQSNERFPSLVKRYVSIQNFEDSHDYSYDKNKGKPLSAWEFARDIDIQGDASIVKFVRQIVGISPRELEFTPSDLESLVVEDEIEDSLQTCPVCNGKCKFGKEDCRACKGMGSIYESTLKTLDLSEFEKVPCPTCDTGRIDCKTCSGDGVVDRHKALDFAQNV